MSRYHNRSALHRPQNCCKNFGKPLDKLHTLWYNKNVPREYKLKGCDQTARKDLIIMAKKMTISEKYALVIGKAERGEPLSKEDIAFLIERRDSVEKKNANRGLTKEQKENEVIKAEILETMAEGVKYTIGDLMKIVPKCSGLANQKVSALVRQLKEANLVIRSEEKGRAYFTKA